MTPPPLSMSVAVVSYNTRDLLLECMSSVMAASPEALIVVDNGSADDSSAAVRAAFPGATLIANDENRGYGAAANQAVAACSTEAVLLLNSDTTIEPDSLTALGAELATHPRAAIVGPRLANQDGSLQRSTFPFPSVGDLLLAETGLHLLVRRIPVLRERFYRTWSHDGDRRVPWVKGAALAIRRSAFEAVGGFDEGFFMYSEEVDLCRRLAGAGFEVRYSPVTTVVHVGGESTRLAESAMRRERLVAGRRYLQRNESRSTAAFVLRTLQAIVAARWVRDVIGAGLAGGERRAHRRADARAKRALLTDRELWRA